MLRNVAIPLVLLATEAEGVAAELSEKDLAKAMAADLLHDLPALTAGAAACEDSDSVIAAAKNDVATQLGVMNDAIKAMEDLRDGAYDVALKPETRPWPMLTPRRTRLTPKIQVVP